MAVVDEFATGKRRLSNDLGLVTRSVIERGTSASPTPRRVVSANIPRVQTELTDGLVKRVRSANASMAVADSSSIGLQDQDLGTNAQPGRATTSRLDIISNTSNWPNVDEEALLREQITPQALRITSAPTSKHSKDSYRRSATLPSSAKESEPHARTIVVEMPPLKRHENSPAPPPPSPEPAQKSVKPRLSDNATDVSEVVMNGSAIYTDSIDIAAEANCGESDTAPIVHERSEQTVESEGGKQPNPEYNGTPVKETELDASQHLQGKNVDTGNMAEVLECNIEVLNKTYNPEAGACNGPPGQLDTPEKQQEDKLTLNMELSNNVTSTTDPLSMVPDALYKELDSEREISLSAPPPSGLETPDLSAPIMRVQEKVGEVAPSDVAAVMKQYDQGGLSGH